MLKVFIVDNHPVVAEGLIKIIDRGSIHCNCTVFYSAEDLFNSSQKGFPDIIISDINLPGIDGIEMIRRFKKIHSKLLVLFFTMNLQTWRVMEIIDLKANGLIFKSYPTSEVLIALNEISKGNNYFCAEAKEQIFNLTVSGKTLRFTQREKQVLNLITRGLTTKQIAKTLYISANTIESYRRILFQKLNVSNSASMIAKANDLGLVNLN